MEELTCLEICAGAGGQAIGLGVAGFEHVALVEIDHRACDTLRLNRPDWRVIEEDIRNLDGREFRGIDLLSGGVPCPPFSVAGKQLGQEDDRDLLPQVIRLVREAEPQAVMVENVRGLLDPTFDSYRERIGRELELLGYRVMGWRLLQASDFGVPQLRPRVVMVAIRPEYAAGFSWPRRSGNPAPTVGEALRGEMASAGWTGAAEWARKAGTIAPTLVGGSHKHGGPDLGPTRARRAWAKLGVDGKTLAEKPPAPGHNGMVRLTVRMAAVLQGFSPEWVFAGGKTQAYRQVGNAFPPPVAQAVGRAIRGALVGEPIERVELPESPYLQEELPISVG